ncbi:MAG TPA: AraC family transcriptional regulator ligand-binding domain-containing protein [Rugosimonospora sp.]|nr:AraC family transcriptional regulator ligand-binding domain-containing protein [Rugosimonospora sp.]
MELARMVLSVAAAGGADAGQIAREAGLPGWLLGTDGAMVPSTLGTRLWELTEHALGDPLVGLTAVSRHRVGDLDLYDYLFTTAATLREGLRVSADYFYLISTNTQMWVVAETGRDVTFGYRHALAGGRGEELWTQFSIAGFCARASAVTGGPVMPTRVTFRQSPPRSYRGFVEAFGTRRVDFDAPVTTFTLRAADLDRAMPAADPVLAGILRRYAATLHPGRAVTWFERFRELLAESIEQGRPTLGALALRLAVSVSTLQRRLAEHGTSFRAELEAARQRQVAQARQVGRNNSAEMASALGYADPRSVRRALRRWEDRSGRGPVP